MSWSSVVAGSTADVDADSGEETTADQVSDGDNVESKSPSVSFQMTPLAGGTAPTPEPVSTPTPPPAPISFTMGTPVADEKGSTTPGDRSSSVDEIADATVATVRPDIRHSAPAPAPLSLSIPLVSDTSVENSPSAATLEPVELPTIVEATPPDSVTRSVAALHLDPNAEPEQTAPPAASPVVADPAPVVEPRPVVESAPVSRPAPVAQTAQTAPVAQSAPAVAAPQPAHGALTLPRNAAVPMVPHATPVVDGGSPKKGPKKDRTTAVARLGFFLLFIAAVVSAGVIFGRPYLFPPEWEDNALPYAEAIEQARGTAFAEPVLLTAQGNPEHRNLVSTQLLGDAQADMPLWRALGLAGPDATDDASLRDLTSVQAPVLYSAADGQVYYDETFTQAHRDRLIMQAMATAAIDQDVRFSPNAADRGLDANALVDAHVLQQSTYIAEMASTTRVPVPEPDVAALAFLPPVLDYRLTAPVVLSQVLAPVDNLAVNPLEGVGGSGPTGARDSVLPMATSTSNVAGDVAVGEVMPMDRGFWYLVFASHLDATTAYTMSNVLDRAGMQSVLAADGRSCVVVTFATANGPDHDFFSASMATWSATTAPELGASVSASPDMTVQLRSCDPGTAFASNARFGIGRELIGWRAVETAVVDTLSADGADTATVDRALAQISATPSVQEIISLPAGTPPSEVAASVRTAAVEVVAATVPAPAVDAGG